MGLGAQLFEFRRHQDPRVANESKLKFDRTAVLYVKYVVDTFLFLIISFQMVEALLEEAQEDITPEVGSEVILVDEAGETPGTPWSFSCITSTTFSFAVPDAIRAQLCTCVAFLRKKNNSPFPHVP